MADSSVGDNYLCHTFVPNVTVNWKALGGASIKMKLRESFLDAVGGWSVYIHDRQETVFLSQHAIDNPVVVVNDKNNKVNKVKVQLSMTNIINPGTEYHPCNNSQYYSKIR